MIAEATYGDEAVTLQPGDRLYFYTDGVIEALNEAEQEFGHARLTAEIERLRGQPVRDGLDAIADMVVAWSCDRVTDDVSLLTIERLD